MKLKGRQDGVKQSMNIYKKVSFYIALLCGLIPFSVFVAIRRLLDSKRKKES
jgi:hypothetical protein